MQIFFPIRKLQQSVKPLLCPGLLRLRVARHLMTGPVVNPVTAVNKSKWHNCNGMSMGLPAEKLASGSTFGGLRLLLILL